jgi:cell division protein FtsQ
MRSSSHIRKILYISLWGLAATGLIVLLIAAMNSRGHQTCKGFEIDINSSSKGHWFVDKADIVRVLTNNNTTQVKNKSIKSFDLHRIEARLKRELWIRDAELFFDNNGILQVKVKEREPIARIFSSTGVSFYLDSSGQRLPLSDKMSARLPVFTGFPNDGKKIKATERKLVNDIKQLSLFLLNNPFWMAQVSQIDITPSKEFEMVPTIGNHLVEFGDGDNYEEKFHRLLVFYKQVLARSGMEKYKRIKVQYDKQVIGVKKEYNN